MQQLYRSTLAELRIRSDPNFSIPGTKVTETRIRNKHSVFPGFLDIRWHGTVRVWTEVWLTV